MKRALSLLLVLVMQLSLCACGKNDTQNTDPGTTSSQVTSENKEDTTSGTTEDKQETSSTSTASRSEDKQETSNTSTTTRKKDDTATTKQPPSAHVDKDNGTQEEQTSTPDEDEQGPSKESSDTESDEPSDCEHTYSTVSCTIPKMCTKCHHIAGNALPHNYKDGSCTVCGKAENLVTFQVGDWVANVVKAGTGEQGEVLSQYILDEDKDHYSSFVCYSNANACIINWGKVTHNNKAYYSDWYFTTFTRSTWEENGDTITITINFRPSIEIVLTKTSETQLTVISSTNTAYVPVGIVFNKT